MIILPRYNSWKFNLKIISLPAAMVVIEMQLLLRPTKKVIDFREL